MPVTRSSLRARPAPRKSNLKVAENVTVEKPSDKLQGLYDRIEKILTGGKLPVERIKRSMKLPDDALTSLQTQVRDAFDEASDQIELSDHATPHLLKLLGDLNMNVDGIEKNNGPVGWKDLLNCLQKFTTLSNVAAETKPQKAVVSFVDTATKSAKSSTSKAPKPGPNGAAESQNLVPHTKQPITATASKPRKTTRPSVGFSKQVPRITMSGQPSKPTLPDNTDTTRPTDSAKAGAHSAMPPSPAPKIHQECVARPAFYPGYQPGPTWAEYTASTRISQNLETNLLHGNPQGRRMMLRMRADGRGVERVPANPLNDRKRKRDARDDHSPISTTHSAKRHATMKSADFDPVMTRKQLLHVIWKKLICKSSKAQKMTIAYSSSSCRRNVSRLRQ
jgi:hypothetical protein